MYTYMFIDIYTWLKSCFQPFSAFSGLEAPR